MKLLDANKRFFWRLQMKDLQKNSSRLRQMLSLKESKTLGIFFVYDQPQDLLLIQNFANSLRDMSISVKILAFSDSKVLPADLRETSHFSAYCAADLKYNLVPKTPKVLQFTREAFDMYFDLCLHPHLQSDFVSLSSKATFKIGCLRPSDYKIFDFQLEVSPDTDLKSYLMSLMKYLNIF